MNGSSVAEFTDDIGHSQPSITRDGSWSRQILYSTAETRAAIDITWTGTEKRVYYALNAGADRAYVQANNGSGWAAASIAPGFPIQRLAVERNANGIDILYLVDFDNLALYYGRYDGSGATPPPVTPLFSDDFEDGNSIGWTAVSGSWSVTTDGTKVYKQTNSSGEALANAGDATWTDYSVQADIKLYNNATNAGSGVLARYVDSNNYYMLRLQQTGKVQLYKKAAGTFTLLGEAAQTVTAGSTYTLKLEVNGSALTGYVNGVEKISAVTDTAISSGKIGVRSYSQSVAIDNVSVTSIQ